MIVGHNDALNGDSGADGNGNDVLVDSAGRDALGCGQGATEGIEQNKNVSEPKSQRGLAI